MRGAVHAVHVWDDANKERARRRTRMQRALPKSHDGCLHPRMHHATVARDAHTTARRASTPSIRCTQRTCMNWSGV
eukprot:8480-Eustigmatos_ZCMA.PRE.1